MITRFIEKGDIIYPIKSSDNSLVAVAFRRGDNWSYLTVNNSNESKKVSFLNNTKFPQNMEKYIYLENSVPSDNKVISGSGNVTPDGRVLTENIPARSFVLYTTLQEN